MTRSVSAEVRAVSTSCASRCVRRFWCTVGDFLDGLLPLSGGSGPAAGAGGGRGCVAGESERGEPGGDQEQLEGDPGGHQQGGRHHVRQVSSRALRRPLYRHAGRRYEGVLRQSRYP